MAAIKAKKTGVKSKKHKPQYLRKGGEVKSEKREAKYL